MQPNYKDGAIFAKVGFINEKDPVFPSSEVPSGTKRYQFMVKNKNKYEASEGWGYALFTYEGSLYREDLVAKTAACVACHALVPERNFVFSRPMQFQFGSHFPKLIGKKSQEESLPFIEKPLKEFSKGFKAQLNPDTVAVNSLEGPLKKSAFSGTLDEIIPLLLGNSKESGRSTALYLNEKNYSLVSPRLKSSNCVDEKAQYSVIVIFNGKLVKSTTVCQ